MLRGTMRKPTQGMAKRLVTNPMGEIRLKWSATKGAVPNVATAETRKENLIYFQMVCLQEVFREGKISSRFNIARVRGTR